MNRRQFVNRAVSAPMLLYRAKAGPNDTIRVGVIGTGGRASYVGKWFAQNKDVAVPLICDVNQLSLRRAHAEFFGGQPEMVEDYRRILDRRDIDAVLIGTPDHWHALQTIHACQAGKDVYVEKPAAWCITEGQRMVQAARKYGRVIQVGSQQLSGPHYHEAARIVQSGGIGKVSHVHAWNVGNRSPGAGFPPDEDPPKTLNWDYWVGPAPMTPYNRLRAAGTFRSFWAYGGGIMTDWGAHHVGSAHQIMGVDQPLSAVTAGGRFVLRDMFETPDTFTVLWQYPNFTFEFSYREANNYTADGARYGILFHGTDATLFIDRLGFEITPENKKVQPRVEGSPRKNRYTSDPTEVSHIRDFLDCMRSRKRPIADIEAGHRAVIGPHLGNISLRTGRKINWDRERQTIAGDQEAAAMLSRPSYRAPYLLPEV
jgi:predicted dehydrogenase